MTRRTGSCGQGRLARIRALRVRGRLSVLAFVVAFCPSTLAGVPSVAPLPPPRPAPGGDAVPLGEWQALDQSLSFNADMWTDGPREPVWAELSVVAAQMPRGSSKRAIAPILTLAPVARGHTEGEARLVGPLAAPREKAFGLRLKAGERVSISTEFASGEGSWQPVDTRLAWRVARHLPADEGWVWAAGVGGGLPVGRAPYSQTVDLTLGRRFREGAWSLMPGLSVSTAYTSYGGDRWQATLTPEVKARVDMLRSADERLRLYLESSVGYAVPVGADAAGLSAATRLNLIFRPGG